MILSLEKLEELDHTLLPISVALVKVKPGMPPSKNVMVLEVTGILGRGNIPSESEWCVYIYIYLDLPGVHYFGRLEKGRNYSLFKTKMLLFKKNAFGVSSTLTLFRV